MPNFKCKNQKCKEFGKITFRNKVSFKFNEETKKFDIPFGKQVFCDVCGKEMEFQEKKFKSIPNIYLTKFKQLPIEEKKKSLKKRADEHNKTKMKDRVHEVKKKFGLS